LDYFPENFGAFGDEREQHFHQDITNVEERYQGK
jgi:hypothetical protein